LHAVLASEMQGGLEWMEVWLVGAGFCSRRSKNNRRSSPSRGRPFQVAHYFSTWVTSLINVQMPPLLVHTKALLCYATVSTTHNTVIGPENMYYTISTGSITHPLAIFSLVLFQLSRSTYNC